jgi:hypothetical protein
MSRKLKVYVARVSVFFIPVALVVGTAGFDGVGGALSFPPSQNSPPQNLEIRTWYDLDAVRYNLAGNHTVMNDLGANTSGYEELAGEIANQGKGWQPIGSVEIVAYDSPCGGGFTTEDWHGLNGTFDGQGYEIRDLFIDRPTENDVGLFGVVDEGGVIKDIGAVNVTVIGEHYTGGLVGRNRGTVNSSYFSGSVTGGSWVGGLVGANRGTVSDSYSSSDSTGRSYVGGLVGFNSEEGTVSNCYSNGNVTGNGKAGGLVGTSDRGTVSNSFWDVQTSGQPASDGGTGKTTAEMKNIATFSDAGWNIVAVASRGTRNPSYMWNMVDGETNPFLSWQPIS